MPTKKQIEIGARAIWDVDAADCRQECRWGEPPECLCRTMVEEQAGRALEAVEYANRWRRFAVAAIAAAGWAGLISTVLFLWWLL